MHFPELKRRYHLVKWQKLVGVSVLIGVLAGFMAISLKHLTEHYEAVLFGRSQQHLALVFAFPLLGLTLIYVLKQHLFKKKENKGIREIYDSLAPFKKLPIYKIPSHFVNGLITVVFGGSTGIEVSTVVASAAVGSAVHEKQLFFGRYRKELICAGIAAGITALFNSPLAGILFTFEVISRQRSAVRLVTVLIAALTAWALLYIVHEEPLFEIAITGWDYEALPYFAALGVFAALNSVYLTKSVLLLKKYATKVQRPEHRILGGALLIGLLIAFFPQLYGDSYHAVKASLAGLPTLSFTYPVAITFAAILLLKPLIVSITLSSGGDGGVFAPSLVTGAFAGLLLSLAANHFFGAHVSLINFMLVGMAAVLSATIHAPFTAVFLVCGLSANYSLLVPLLMVCLISKFVAKSLFPFTVYNFNTARA